MGPARADPGAGFPGPEAKNKGDWDGRPCTSSAETQPAKTVLSLGGRRFHDRVKGCLSRLLDIDRAAITGIAMGKGPLIGPAKAMEDKYFVEISTPFSLILLC
jgi:hypothetical protein